MTSLTLVLLLIGAPLQEVKPVPKDSVEVHARGCLKGRVFTATAPPEDEGVVQGPDVVGRHFRVGGPREVMDVVKKHDGHLVAIVGIVRKSALADEGIGMKVGGARVVIGAPGTDPMRPTRNTAPSVPTMDLTAVRSLSDRCDLRP